MTVLGYFITCDDALCADCYARDDVQNTWNGFEGWDEPLPITRGDEADTPTHCVTCEKLIAHQLTRDGLDYVDDALRSALLGHGGRRAIVRQWVEKYLPSQASIVAAWPTRDQWSPKEQTV